MIHTVRNSPSKAVAAVLLTLCFFLGSLIPAFGANGISNEQIAAAAKIARQMEDEGLVLLKNDGNFLPLRNK